MKAVLLSIALLFTAGAFAVHRDDTFTTTDTDVTGGAYDATVGATGGLGATMNGAVANRTGSYGLYGRQFANRGRAGDYMNRWRDNRMNTQVGTQVAPDASDVTY